MQNQWFIKHVDLLIRVKYYPCMASDLLSITQAAERRGVSRQWIHKLIQDGKLKAEQVGEIFVLKTRDVDACDMPGPGRPRANGKTHASPTAKRSKKRRVGRGASK